MYIIVWNNPSFCPQKGLQMGSYGLVQKHVTFIPESIPAGHAGCLFCTDRRACHEMSTPTVGEEKRH